MAVNQGCRGFESLSVSQNLLDPTKRVERVTIMDLSGSSRSIALIAGHSGECPGLYTVWVLILGDRQIGKPTHC